MEAKSSLAQKVVPMSLFSWFARKPPSSTRALSSGLSRSDETRPLGRGQSIPGTQKATISADPKKNARYMRRELLYAIVRESMVRFGVLSAGYKFKALALDPRGLKFMVMVGYLPPRRAIKCLAMRSAASSKVSKYPSTRARK